MQIVAFIFARGNSKGIKNKNLLKFKNTTLLGNAINQARKVNYVSRIFVSTDSKKISAYSIKCKAEVPFIRPKKYSRDNSPEIDAWRHAVKYLKNKMNLKPNYIISIPTTCPLRNISDLNKCLKKAIKNNLDLVLTASTSPRNPYFNIISKKNKRLNIISKFFQNKKQKKITRRQDAPKTYDLTTACYVFKPDYIINNDDIFFGKVDFVEIPRERAVDIDDKFDYKLVQLLSSK